METTAYCVLKMMYRTLPNGSLLAKPGTPCPPGYQPVKNSAGLFAPILKDCPFRDKKLRKGCCKDPRLYCEQFNQFIITKACLACDSEPTKFADFEALVAAAKAWTYDNRGL